MKTRVGLGSILVCDEDLTVLVTKHSDNGSMSERTVLFSNHISGEDYSFTEDEIQRCDNFSELYKIDIIGSQRRKSTTSSKAVKFRK